MKTTLEQQIIDKKLPAVEQFVKEMEEKPFIYLGNGHWYSRQTDCIYKLTNRKLEFVAQYKV
ncbi:MAG: hypothetical protein HY363_01825 [Candidatus Aenigmarchaeota archaeon]|nr:hypothetical protein [Candidatus Aenigmarchaeota archaeon]